MDINNPIVRTLNKLLSQFVMQDGEYLIKLNIETKEGKFLDSQITWQKNSPFFVPGISKEEK